MADLSRRSLADRLPEPVLLAIMLVYGLSLMLGFGAAQAFFVVTAADIFIVAGMSTIPAFVAWHFMRAGQSGIVVAGLHLYLAILYHPRVTFKEPMYLDEKRQLQLLERFHSGTVGEASEREIARILAQAIENDARLRFSIDHPIMFWAYPPSLLLLFWSAVLFILLRRRAESSSNSP